mgnify:CR=1 FL=1
MLSILLILFIGIKVEMPTWFWILYGIVILIKTFVAAFSACIKIYEPKED